MLLKTGGPWSRSSHYEDGRKHQLDMLPSVHIQNRLLVEWRWLDQNHCLCICLEWAPWMGLSLEDLHEVLSLYNRLHAADVSNRLPPFERHRHSTHHDILWISSVTPHRQQWRLVQQMPILLVMHDLKTTSSKRVNHCTLSVIALIHQFINYD